MTGRFQGAVAKALMYTNCRRNCDSIRQRFFKTSSIISPWVIPSHSIAYNSSPGSNLDRRLLPTQFQLLVVLTAPFQNWLPKSSGILKVLVSHLCQDGIDDLLVLNLKEAEWCDSTEQAEFNNGSHHKAFRVLTIETISAGANSS